MSRIGRVVSAAPLVAVLTLTACADVINGTATPDAAMTAPSATGTSAPSAPAAPTGAETPHTADLPEQPEQPEQEEQHIAEPGECISGDDPSPVDCAQPHTVEIIMAGTFGGAMPDEPPERAAVFEAVFPTCRAESAQYLGDDHSDMTTLAAWLLWPGPDEWKQGARWYRCGVAELGPEGQAHQRTGSVRGALADGGIHEFRLCTKDAPSSSLPNPVSCEAPHRSEAIAVLPVGGGPSDPPPTEEEFDATAQQACEQALTNYLGAERDDVHAEWHRPDEVAWGHGFNNVTCYAHTDDPVTAPLHGIGSGPLPR